jgi:adenosylcobinamide-GDP ribazoletransferase
MALAPLTGLVPGLTAAVAVWVGLQLDLSPLLLAVISVGLFALTTRGLHLDGLADTADGLAASYDRDRALAVMRRGDTGPAGVAAVVLILALQVAALSEVLGDAVQRWSDRALAQTSNGEIVVTATRAVTGPYDGVGLTDVGPLRAVVVLVVVAVAARVAVSLACARGIGPARPEGLGAMVAGSVERRTLGLVLAAVLIACSLGASIAGFTWWSGALAVLIVVAGTAAVIRRAVRRFGGITGDVLGAAVEVGTTAALLALAVAG